MKTRQIVNCRPQLIPRLLVSCWAFASALVFSHGAEDKWTGSAEVSYVTQYLWRGSKLASDSIQPSVTEVFADKLTLGIWGDYGLKKNSHLDPNGNGRYGETDYLANYTFSQGAYSLTVGGTLYGIDDLVDPEDNNKSFKYYFESLVSVSLKTKFSPTLTFWREFGRLKTNYVEFSVSESIELNKQCRLNFRPYIGAWENSQRYFGADVSLNYEFGHQFYGRATVTFVRNNYTERHERANFGIATGRHW